MQQEDDESDVDGAPIDTVSSLDIDGAPLELAGASAAAAAVVAVSDIDGQPLVADEDVDGEPRKRAALITSSDAVIAFE